MNPNSIKRREVGQRLHEAETALGVGRRAVRELVTSDPIDEEALAKQRTAVLSARLKRNALLGELASLKSTNRWAPMPWVTSSPRRAR